MEKLLPKVYRNLSSYVMEHKAVSGEELMWKIGQEMDSLTDEEKKGLEKLLEGDPEQVIFDGIVGKVRVSVFSPDMHVQLNYLGEIFYCPPTHKYMPDELDKAFKRLVNRRFDQISRIVENTVTDLMTKSGYEVSDIQSEITCAHKAIKAVKDDSELPLFMLPSIVYVSENMEALKRLTVKHVVMVPSEKSPAPFVTFIRENMDGIRENAKMMIWVVNPDQETVSPFMGNPKDNEIWKHLKDPEKTLQATENWIKGAVRSRVLDEDF